MHTCINNFSQYTGVEIPMLASQTKLNYRHFYISIGYPTVIKLVFSYKQSELSVPAYKNTNRNFTTWPIGMTIGDITRYNLTLVVCI